MAAAISAGSRPSIKSGARNGQADVGGGTVGITEADAVGDTMAARVTVAVRSGVVEVTRNR
jgi:hypothetical protein